MYDFTRRSFFRRYRTGCGRRATGPALLDFAKAWRRRTVEGGSGRQADRDRWKRFVPRKTMRSTPWLPPSRRDRYDMNVFSESFEDVQPKASVPPTPARASISPGALHTLPQLFPTKF